MKPTRTGSATLAADLRRATMHLGRRMRAERPDDAASLAQLLLLGRLYREGAATPGALAAGEGVQPQSVTRQLASLEAEGWTQRTRHPADGRQALIEITEAGRAIIERDMKRRDEWLARAIGTTLDTDERELLAAAARLIERLAAS